MDRDWDEEFGGIKPRRKDLTCAAKDFFGSLVEIIDDDDDGDDEGTTGTRRRGRRRRWVFAGVLNGWPGHAILELRKIEVRPSRTRSNVVVNKRRWKTRWTARTARGVDPAPPTYPFADDDGRGKEPSGDVRVTLRGPPWTGRGWSESSPGFLFWAYHANDASPGRSLTVKYGTDVVRSFQTSDAIGGESRCTRVHMISHRYPKPKPTPRDYVAYHSLALLEWDHGECGTVVECAWRNGLGGYRGQYLCLDDLNEPVTELYGAMPPEMVLPWKSTVLELRCVDVPHGSTLDRFRSWMSDRSKKNTKKDDDDRRFLDVRVTFSSEVKLIHRSKSQIASYLLAYIRRDCTYTEMRSNCQTFASDLCSFLSGNVDVRPYHPLNRAAYRNRRDLFLYE